ncbi:MAG: hypothetical protein KJ906_00975 [Nanoarchaeota archaeon]|nr:hypothetical protein [Nanoarchaeota archaeon]
MVKTMIIEDGKIIEGEVIEREIVYEDAKKEVAMYFQMKGTSDIADLHQSLRIPVCMLTEIIDEYIQEGKLE